jgi:hypothetical protein
MRDWLRRWWSPQPSTTEQMRALFSAESRLRWKFTEPVKSKFRLKPRRVEDWIRRYAERKRA